MYIYGVFRNHEDTAYGILCCNREYDKPALFANEEDAISWADYLQSHYDDNVYSVFKFNLNPNGFTSERVY